MKIAKVNLIITQERHGISLRFYSHIYNSAKGALRHSNFQRR